MTTPLRKLFVPLILGLLLLGSLAVRADDRATLQTLKAGWNNPARTYKPHTRWWWPGNALTKADITWQMEQMAGQGMGGVEIMSAWKMFEQGNHDYLSPEFIELVKHAVAEGKRLNLDVAITFGPGWSFGGAWVPKADQSKCLCLGEQVLAGGSHFSGPLPDASGGKRGKGRGELDRLVAVVAGRIVGDNQLDSDSLTVLTAQVKGDPTQKTTLDWEVPAGGQWRLMAFRLKYTGQTCQAENFTPAPMVIDHLNKGAMQRYCDYLGGTYYKAFGSDFGTTVDSFFCDSFEIMPLPNSLLWSDDTLQGFQKHAGYDLTKYLPSLWYDIGEPTTRVRYDLGSYLSDLGLDTIFKTFNDWCDAHKVQARIQPHYRFTEELVQGAGATARPETEVTTARFEPVADPHKATASGARFYGRGYMSSESFTFIHPARYRTDLEDIKMATDAFLRDGVTQFYNHGYFGSPEMHVVPSRDMPWANRISHWNTWWKYYHNLTAYTARCCATLRQGRLVSDVLIYSPQATAWSERALWGSDRRVLPYGNLAKTLVANGYDFDIVNDDLLQHRAQFTDGGVTINGYHYRVLVLPRATVLPIESLRAIRDFARAGGTIIALESLPAAAAGLVNHEANDRELQQTVADLFGTGGSHSGKAVFLPDYQLARTPFNPMRQPYTTTAPLTEPQRKFLATINEVTPPDFVLAGNAQSDGLTFIHKRVDNVDVYFVSNLEPKPITTEVTFRVAGKTPQRWDAVTGKTGEPVDFRKAANGTTIPVTFEPWESAFYIFTDEPAPPQVTPTVLTGPLPEPQPIAGTWKMKLAGFGFDTLDTTISQLTDWTKDERTRHFSGTGHYEIEFDLPAERIMAGTRMTLDLGQVGDLAEVWLNGQSLGTSWMAPHRLDITAAARAGKNVLVVEVTDTLINYVSGMKAMPDVAPELQARLGHANPTIYENSGHIGETHETDLPPSGLIGPVQIKWSVAR